MAKVLQSRPSQHDRDQAGCIWGLISLFDFRHGRSTRKLLGDKRRVSRQAVGVNRSTKTILPGPVRKFEDVEDGEESKTAMAEVVKTSIKERVEEDMLNEKGSKNHENKFKIGFKQIDSQHRHQIKQNHKHINRISNTSGDTDVSELDAAKCLLPAYVHKVPEQKPSNSCDLETIMEELCQVHQRRTRRENQNLHNNLERPSHLALSVAEEKLVAAAKVFIEHKLINNGKHFGEDLMNAQQTLNSNKTLFLKLLQDPNSALVKRIQNLEDARPEKDQMPYSLTGSNLPEEKLISSKCDDFKNCERGNVFRRRSESMESYLLGGNENCQASSKIVILKPGQPATDVDVGSTSLRLHYPTNNKVQNEKNTGHFSFTEIKRKLRHAIGKERRAISPDGLILNCPLKHQNGNDIDKGAAGEIVGWSSPNRNHFYTERFSKSSTGYKRGEEVGKSKDNGSVLANKTSQYPRKEVSNIYVEAKKHLFEMLKNEDDNVVSTSRELPKSLGRILSLPDYNSSSCRSPGKFNDDSFITSQMRLSPRGMVKNMNHDSLPSLSKQNLESQPHSIVVSPNEKERSFNRSINTPCEYCEGYSAETLCCTKDVRPEVQDSSSRVVEFVETIDLRHQEGEQNMNISCESTTGNSISVDIQISPLGGEHDQECSFQCLKSDSIGGDDLVSSPMVPPLHCPVTTIAENPESTIDKIERPSPISVLGPLCTEDDISPMCTMGQPAGKEFQLQQLNFKEQSSAIGQGMWVKTSIEDEESAYEYVEAVLLGSGLNWNDFLLRWLSLYEILDSSLFDEVELFSSQSRLDQKILFDCTNGVLEEVCESYFGCFTGIYDINMNIQPVPKRMDLIQEVWKRVEWHLVQHIPPHSPDKLVKKDMAKSRKWLEIRPDIEHIGTEMEENIFNELVDDTILSFVDYVSEL